MDRNLTLCLNIILMTIKIIIFTFNRAEYSKLKPIILGLKSDPEFEVVIVAGGTHLLYHYGMTINDVKSDFEVDMEVNTLIYGDNIKVVPESVGMMMCKIPQILEVYMPDCILVHGDRFDILGVVQCAYLMNIYIVHIEGGEMTGTLDDNIRHAVSQFAHMHIVSTVSAKKMLKKMGENNIKCTGCPIFDMYRGHIDGPNDLKVGIKGINVTPKKYILCMFHPVVNDIDNCVDHFTIMCDTMNEMTSCNGTDFKVLIWYPNIDHGGIELVKIINRYDWSNKDAVITIKNVCNNQFITLLRHSSLVIGNSSCGIREVGYFGIPSINIGNRQLNREHGDNVVDMAHPNKKILASCITKMIGKVFLPDYRYGDGKSVIRIIRELKNTDFSNIIKSQKYTKFLS